MRLQEVAPERRGNTKNESKAGSFNSFITAIAAGFNLARKLGKLLMVRRSDHEKPIGLLSALDRLYSPKWEEVQTRVTDDAQPKLYSNDPNVKLGMVTRRDSVLSQTR